VTTAQRCPTDDVHCITCSDEGIEMTVVALTQCGAQCRDPAGIDQRIEIELVEPVEIGDRLLVHAGVAIANVSRPPAPNQAALS
jgi:hydrogenase expression/formation protein HypC